jgi:DNA-binding response OmpR family regulator
MEVWIIEDEIPAARRITKLAEQADAAIRITATYATVADTVAALRQHQPDLLLMDIHLADGNSFHIFKQVEV